MTGPPAISNVSYGEPAIFNCSAVGGDGDVSIEWTIDGRPISDLGYANLTCVETESGGCMQQVLTINTSSIDDVQETMNIKCIVRQNLSSMAAEERMNGDMLEVRLPRSNPRAFPSQTKLHIEGIPTTTTTTVAATTSPNGLSSPSGGGKSSRVSSFVELLKLWTGSVLVSHEFIRLPVLP